MAKRRANNEGTIYKRSNGGWRAQITLNGQRLSHSGKSQRECQEWIKEIRNQIDGGLTYNGADIELQDFLSNWLIGVSSSRSRGTTKLYRWTVDKQINPYIGTVKLKDLKPDQIQNYYDFMRKEGRSSHAVYCIHKVLRISLNHAVKLGVIGHNPCLGTNPPRPKQTEMKFFDEKQVHEFLAAAQMSGDRFYPLYYLAIHTGMRQGELLGLKWEDVDLQRRKLQVRRQVRYFKGGEYRFTKPKSKNGHRTIILGQQAAEIVQEHQSKQWDLIKQVGEKWTDHDLVFPSKVGTPVRDCNLRRTFRKTLKISGLPKIRFHDLRHTAASLMLNHGIPVLIASKRLGHSKPSITMDVYGHLLPIKQEEVAHLMDELMTPIDVSRCTIFAPKANKKP